MPELKRNFSQAKMNKDMDERLVPKGQYRDALNIQIATSDDSNVGSAQNLRGNNIIQQMANVYENQKTFDGNPQAVLTASSVDNAVYGLPIFVPDGPIDTNAISPYHVDLGNSFTGTGGIIIPANLYNASGFVVHSRDDARWVGTSACVGSVALPDKDKIYYLISGGQVNQYPGFTVPRGQTNGMPKKDYIIEYDTKTSRLKYVFVDIYEAKHVCATSTIGSSLFIGEELSIFNSGWASVLGNTMTNPLASQINITGVRIGMSVSGIFNNKSITVEDGVFVTDLIHISGTGWQIFTNKDVDISAGDVITFSAPRVLNFNQEDLITGINVIDDLLFWTDNNTEPKKINIKRCKAGTGGVEYLFTGNLYTQAGHAGGGITNIGNTPDPITGLPTITGGLPLYVFDGDTDYYHTRLVTDKDNKGQLQIETTSNNTKVVWMREDHITVIRKAPTQPLELEMSRTKNPRINSAGVTNPSVTTTTPFSFALTGSSVLVETGDILGITPNTGNIVFNQPVDFREGDILIFTDTLGTESISSFEDFEVRCKVVASPVTDADNLHDGSLTPDVFELEILSIKTGTTTAAKQWFVRLESGEPLFEFKFARFSYRYKYVDGEYSPFAPFSQIAFLPDLYSFVPKKGYNLGMRNTLRSLTLKKYFTDPIGAVPEDVVEIDLLYKETNNPTVYTVKTIKPTDGHPMWPDLDEDYLARGKFELKNDLIHAVVPSNQLLRPWDNVPRKALGQEITANRIVYGNYLQNYNIEDPEIEVGLSSTKLEDLDTEYATPSVKSLRTYQVGVVFSDDYGRETPVLTNKNASITVPKTASTTRNRIKATLGRETDRPSWAKYFSWYIKETSTEYYTMVMDRWYFAADGNIWVSFPSSERNKVDDETFLILKKAHGSNTAVIERARYKILAIENEAPDFIKSEKKGLGDVRFSNTTTVGPCPNPGETEINVNVATFTDEFGELHKNPPDSLYVYFSDNTDRSEHYQVYNIFLDGNNSVRINLKGEMQADVDFCSTDGTLNNLVGNLRLHLVEYEIENRPEFDGRFFVKVYKDPTLDKYVVSPSNSQDDLIPTMSRKIFYLNNNYGLPSGSTTGIWNLGWDDYQKGGVLSNNYTVPSGAKSKPSIHPFNKGNTLNTGGYDHHAIYRWGGNHPTAAPGGHAHYLLPVDIDTGGGEDAGQSHYINYEPGISSAFWQSVADKEAFFIDACSAYALTGSRESGGHVQPDAIGGIGQSDSQDYSYDANAWQVKEGAPNEVPVNMYDGKGQPSRGIWGNGEYMDISWVGFGDGYTGSGWHPSGGYAHKLSEVGTSVHDNAAAFIEKFVTPGTKFRFRNDPGAQIYTIEEWPFYKNSAGGHPHGEVYRSPAAEPTNIYTGVYGIRNYKTSAVALNKADKAQYEGHNLRQRWTVKVSPAIGTGPSGYRPDKGTNGLWDIQYPNKSLAGLAHDMTDDNALSSAGRRGYDVIQIMEPRSSVDPFLNTYTDKPAVWETEPKESVDLDIYYQASGLMPLILNEKTNEEYLPIGTTFLTRTTPNTVHTITEWIETDNGQTIKFTPAIPATINLVDGDDLFLTKRNYYSIGGRVDGTVSPGDETLSLQGYRLTGWWYEQMFRRYHLLDWNNCWCFGNGVESDRIRDDFNAPQMDNGVKASTVLAEPIREERREHGLIYSGIYNSISGVNNLNQFIQAEKITKDLNPIYGSIQKLYSRNTNLLTLCEDKCLTVYSNKDALFNADGNSNLTATSKVLGAAKAYQGDYGISTNPESFAATPGALYFVDQMRGKVLSMFGDNHVRPISSTGMSDYFSDNLKKNSFGQVVGSYDEHKGEYNVTMRYKISKGTPAIASESFTASYNQKIKGWTSFKSFIPENGISLNNDYYTFFGGEIYKHHEAGVDYNRFYDIPYESTVTLTFNDMPQAVKSYNTVNYEGTQAKVDQFISTTTTDAAGNTLTDINDNEYFNLTDKRGWYVKSITTNKQTGDIVDFKEKEGKWFGAVSGDATDGITFGSDTYNLDQSEFSVQGIGNATFKYKGESGSGVNYGGPAQIIIKNMPKLDDPLHGITNYTSTGGWDLTPDDTWHDDNNPYTVWRPEAGNASVTHPYPQTINTQIGAVIPAGVAQMKLSPDNPLGHHMGYLLRAEDFSLGGGTVTATPLQVVTWWPGATSSVQLNSYEWIPGNASAVAGGAAGVGLAAPHVTKVVLYDNAPGSIHNTVQVDIYYNEFTVSDPAEVIQVDIDHVIPPSLMSANVRAIYPYYANQNTPTVTSIRNITGVESQTGDNNQSYIYTSSGSVVSSGATMVSEITFTAKDGFHYASPSVKMQNLVKGGYDYSNHYNTKIVPTRVNNKITTFKAQVFYTPPSSGNLFPDPEEFNSLDHTAFIDFDLQKTSVVLENTITSVNYESSLNRFDQETLITVYGAVGTKYKIQLTKQSSLTSRAPASDGYYDFTTDLFTTYGIDSTQTATIGSDGRNRHFVKMPYVSSKTRYDIILYSVEGSTISTNAPKTWGDASITQYGMDKLTLTPISYAGGMTVPSGYEIQKQSIIPDREDLITAGASATKTVYAEGGNGNSSKTTVTLVSPNKHIKKDMRVLNLGTGTHDITVSSIRDNILTLSSAVAIPNNTIMRFESDKANLAAFDLTIASSGKTLYLTQQPTVDDVSGFESVTVLVDGAVSASTNVTLDSSAGVVPGMVVTSPNTDLTKTEINVSSVTDATDIVLSSAVTLADDETLTFTGTNNDAEVVDIQAKIIDGNVRVKGVLKINSISEVYIGGTLQSTAIAYIYLDNFIVAH